MIDITPKHDYSKSVKKCPACKAIRFEAEYLKTVNPKYFFLSDYDEPRDLRL